MMPDWIEIGRQRVLDLRWVRVDRIEYRLPDGTLAERFVRIEHDFAVLVAVTESGEFILTREFRPGPGRVMRDLPGGFVESGEDPTTAAARELLEETGYAAGQLRKLANKPVSAYSTGTAHIYLATNCRRIAEQKLDPTELIELELVSEMEFREWVESGDLIDLDAGLLALRAIEQDK